MTFDNETDFEKALIHQLTEHYGWEKELLEYKTEEDLIRNWQQILFQNNRGVEKPMEKVRGDEGELKTLRLLQETVFPKYCRYVMNAVIHTEYTKPNGTVKKRRTEIDILFICTSGIIVIENKELHGILNGSGSEPQWRFTPKGKTNAVKVRNPAAQNRDHITVLNSIYNVSKKLYHSIAVVPRYTQIKVKSGIRKNEHLIHRNELIPTILKIMNTGEDIWTNEEVNNMIEKVLNQ